MWTHYLNKKWSQQRWIGRDCVVVSCGGYHQHGERPPIGHVWLFSIRPNSNIYQSSAQYGQIPITFGVRLLGYCLWLNYIPSHYNDVMMSMMVSEITHVLIAYSTVCSGADQRKHQSSASLAFKRGIHRRPVNSCTKGQQRGKCFHLMTSTCVEFSLSFLIFWLIWYYNMRLCFRTGIYCIRFTVNLSRFPCNDTSAWWESLSRLSVSNHSVEPNQSSNDRHPIVTSLWRQYMGIFVGWLIGPMEISIKL